MWIQKMFRRPSPFVSLISHSRRGFQTHGTRDSGFERMLMDKIKWQRGLFAGGNLFYMFGAANILCYGLSFLMEKDNYDYYFKYQGSGKFFQPIKSLFGSTAFGNVSWTSAFLFYSGHFLQKNLGTIATTKCFGLALLSSYIGVSVFGVPSPFSDTILRRNWPESARFDCIDEKGQTGADLMAGAAIYMCLVTGGYWKLTGAFALFDLCYYGPSMLSGSACAAATMFAIL